MLIFRGKDKNLSERLFSFPRFPVLFIKSFKDYFYNVFVCTLRENRYSYSLCLSSHPFPNPVQNSKYILNK